MDAYKRVNKMSTKKRKRNRQGNEDEDNYAKVWETLKNTINR